MVAEGAGFDALDAFEAEAVVVQDVVDTIRQQVVDGGAISKAADAPGILEPGQFELAHRRSATDIIHIPHYNDALRIIAVTQN